MANNYLLIDFENVQPESIALLDELDFTILLFVGAHQTKIPLALATQLQQLGERARYIRIEGNGPNALDFHIAFTIGELARVDSEGYLHIISRDTGFDPLIRYAR
ncbi:MAG TPA: PIN domain-containing protein [Candidatus Acidoferrales bacterium]|nr:PIN domain-containing protein [Candidatus Acidoferrales bacterium]